MSHLLRRLASGALVLVATSVLLFALAEAAPGDFLSELELDPSIPRETVTALRERYGLDRGVAERYLAWARSALAGDFGYSFAHGRPVGELLLPRARNTLVLTLLASLAAWALALPLGTWMAARQGGWVDRLGLGASAVLLAMPQLLLGLGALLFAAATGAFPAGGMTSLGCEEMGFAARLGDLAWHLALPAAALVLGSLPVLVRHVRSALVEVLDAPFLRVARGHGIRPARLLFRYALPAAANPLISLFGLSVASLLSGALLIEVILSWPGLGTLLLQAILARDLHVVVGATLLSAVFVIAGQLLADLALLAADPRIREAA